MLLLSFFRFWFLEMPVGLMRWLLDFNRAFLQFFSLPLFIRTFFKPLKNEYREGLVGFSIGLGIAFKLWFILLDILLFAVLVGLEVVFFVIVVMLPVLTLAVLALPL